MKLYTASRRWTCQCGCDGHINPGDKMTITGGEILIPGHGATQQETPAKVRQETRPPESATAQQLTLF
jgi:hypothetical protein